MAWWRRRQQVSAKADRAERAVDKLLWERRFERFALLVLVVLYLFGFHGQKETDRRIDRQATVAQKRADKTNTALCALRADLQDRVARTDEFLKQHPDGFAGIPAATLRQQAVGQRRTIVTLSGLACP